jgi:hypothetical protein
LFLRSASIDSHFISENGIAAVLGDDDQLVQGDVRRFNRPLSFERRDRIKYGEIPRNALSWLFGRTSFLNIDPFSETSP